MFHAYSCVQLYAAASSDQTNSAGSCCLLRPYCSTGAACRRSRALASNAFDSGLLRYHPTAASFLPIWLTTLESQRLRTTTRPRVNSPPIFRAGPRPCALCASPPPPRSSDYDRARANAELEEVEGGEEDSGDEDEDDESRSKQSRSEKKSRKAMQKLGMKPVPGIIRCTVKKSKNVRRTQTHENGSPAIDGAWPLPPPPAPSPPPAV
jgi:hypothetical protein